MLWQPLFCLVLCLDTSVKPYELIKVHGFSVQSSLMTIRKLFFPYLNMLQEGDGVQAMLPATILSWRNGFWFGFWQRS